MQIRTSSLISLSVQSSWFLESMLYVKFEVRFHNPHWETISIKGESEL